MAITRWLALVVLGFVATAAASPGGTRADGCHVCHTNCADYGLEDEQEHCHPRTADGSVDYSRWSSPGSTGLGHAPDEGDEAEAGGAVLFLAAWGLSVWWLRRDAKRRGRSQGVWLAIGILVPLASLGIYWLAKRYGREQAAPAK